MPCDSIQTSAVELGKVDHGVLAASLRAAGWKVTHTGGVIRATSYVDGISARLVHAGSACTITTGGSVAAVTSGVKRSYASQLVKTQAGRFGWRVSQGQGGKLLLQKG